MGDIVRQHYIEATFEGDGARVPWVRCACGLTCFPEGPKSARERHGDHLGSLHTQELRRDLHAVTGEDAGASGDTHADVGQSGALEGTGDDAA